MSGKKNLYKKDFILLKINENHTLKNFSIVAHCLSILYTWIPDQIQVKTPLEKKPVTTLYRKFNFCTPQQSYL